MNNKVSCGHGVQRDSATALLTLAFETAAGIQYLRRDLKVQVAISGTGIPCGGGVTESQSAKADSRRKARSAA
jgi:hypothetical protein